jgi:hypothetical protein
MKLHHIATAVALTVAGASSFAAAPAAQYSFHLSGSSALQKVIAQSITNNCSTLTTYKGLLNSASTPSTASGPLDNANGQSQTLYACTVSATSSWGSTYQNKTVNIYYNTQGSAYGVFPVAYGLAISFIDPASCSGSGSSATCNAVVNAVPDAGVSDLEPTMFNDDSNHPVAATSGAAPSTQFPELFSQYHSVSNSNFATGYPKIAAAQTFGIAVSNALLADLQADQGLTSAQIPTISSSAFATIYAPGYSTGSLANWSPLFSNGKGTVGNQVNICSRLPGSGTRASAQAFFLQAPFSSKSQAFATAAGDNTGDVSTLSDTIGQNNAGTYEIGEYDNSAALVGCLQTASANGAYAVGLLSTDRASGGTNNFTFVNLDGSVPNASAAKVGKYQWVYEAFYQVSKNASDAAFATAFYNAFITPANIQALGGANLNGVMGATANCPAPYTGAAAAVCSHVTRNGDARTYLQYAQ